MLYILDLWQKLKKTGKNFGCYTPLYMQCRLNHEIYNSCFRANCLIDKSLSDLSNSKKALTKMLKTVKVPKIQSSSLFPFQLI